MEIIFYEKFTSVDLDSYIKSYWEDSKKEEEIIFNLEMLEWINLEELTFLFGWIRYLKSIDKKIKIILPYASWKPNERNNQPARRRKRRLVSLLGRWKMLESCDLNHALVEGLLDFSSINKELLKRENKDKTWHKIIPFYHLPINFDKRGYSIREVLENEIGMRFDLKTELQELLEKYTSNTPFENKILSDIITTELYLNCLHHSFSESFIGEPQCYFAVSFRNKIDKENIKAKIQSDDIKQINRSIKKILKRNLEEIPKEEQDFYKKKNNEKIEYLNESYVEFSFLDFGNGIPSTLKEAYNNDIANKHELSKLKRQLSIYHFQKDGSKNFKINEDSRILEYSFLLHTSQHPFLKQLEINEYVPRGLYFLIDMIKRYDGMLVVRSNNGKVIYDFSKTHNIREAVKFSYDDSNLPFFQGTLISLFLPAKKKENVKINAIQLFQDKIGSVAYRENKFINLANIQKVENKEKATNVGRFEQYNYLFSLLNNILDKNNISPCILYFDFAGTDNFNIDHKIYYYLCNTPKINEKTNVVIINPQKKEILIDVQESIINSNVFIFRPIPCIYSVEDIIWIGIKNYSDQIKLNELWKYVDENPTAAVSDFSDVTNFSGNVITIEWIDEQDGIGNIGLTVPKIDEILKKYTFEIIPKIFIDDLLYSDTPPKILLSESNTIFWTAGGYYQNKFINFIEKLYDLKVQGDLRDNFGRSVAKYLIGKYNYVTESDLEIDYIVCVTLSSQLLGKFVNDIFHEIYNLDKLNKPYLIRLANYHEFSHEKAFKKINKGSRVLIVNDVISTGKLNQKLYKSLTDQGSNVVAIFTIVDSREDEIKKDNNLKLEVKNIRNEEIENKLIFLTKYPIKKTKKLDQNNYEIISIDPVVNTPNTMKIDRNISSKLIFFNKNEEFISNFKTEFLWIGHLHNNVSHHSYFFKLKDFFLTPEGINLIKLLLNEIQNEETNDLNETKIISKFNAIENIEANIEILRKNHAVSKGMNELENLSLNLKKFIKTLNIYQKEFPFYDVTSFDFVFYPMYSSIESIDEYKLKSEIFNDKNINIFPFPRIDTSKGWRFTFPPKILNFTVKNKNIFILDDGSSTGDTLVQIIDAVAFLEVNKITVLSIVAKMEDFQREFYSRITECQVYKKLDELEQNNRFNFSKIPVSIYFGAHFHIPVYPAFTRLCPFCKEIELLENEIMNKKYEIPDSINQYIQQRLIELKLIDAEEGVLYDSDVDGESFSGIPSYFPQNIDINELFIVRDKLGKIDTYRLYKDYLIQNLDENLEYYLAVILHEPLLFKTIRQFLPKLQQSLIILTKNEIESHQGRGWLKLAWKKKDVIKILSIIDESSFFSKDVVEKILSYAVSKENQIEGDKDSEQAINYIAYFYWRKIFSSNQVFLSSYDSKMAYEIVDEVWHKLYKSNQIGTYIYVTFKELNAIIIKFKNITSNSVPSIFEKLHDFYSIRSTESPNHDNFYKEFDSLYGDVDGMLNLKEQVKNINGIEIEKLIKGITYMYCFEDVLTHNTLRLLVIDNHLIYLS